MTPKSLDKNKTNKAEWEKDICTKEIESNRADDIIAKELELGWEKEFELTFSTIGYIQDGHGYLRFKPNVTPEEVSKYIQDLLSSERQRLIDQVEKEVIGEMDDLEVKLNDGMNGTDYQEGWDDACLEWDLKVNHSVEYLNQKLSAIRKEEK